MSIVEFINTKDILIVADKMKELKILAIRLQELRKHNNLTKSEIALRLNVTF